MQFMDVTLKDEDDMVKLKEISGDIKDIKIGTEDKYICFYHCNCKSFNLYFDGGFRNLYDMPSLYMFLHKIFIKSWLEQ